MSSHIALVANEPQRVPTERARRSEVVEAGDPKVVNVARPTEKPAAQPEIKPVASTTTATEVKEPELKDAVDTVQTVATDMKRELQFSVDEDSGRTIITVIDRESGKIIRQIPPEELLQIADKIAEGGDLNLIHSQA